VVSRSIGQPLATDAIGYAADALSIVYTKFGAVAVAKIELRKIPVQMLLGAMLIDAMHAALEESKRSLRQCWYEHRREHTRPRDA